MATQRLPIPGSDTGTWGSILNGFLEVSHNSDGTLIPSALTQAGAAALSSPSFTGTPTAPTASPGTNTTQLATTAFTTTAIGGLSGQYVSTTSTSQQATVGGLNVPYLGIGGVGGFQGTLQNPFFQNVIINGPSIAPGGPGNTDVVASVLDVTFEGGFSGMTNPADPTYLWGADDYIRTGRTTGDLSGIANLIGRESEMHVQTPGATLTNIIGFQANVSMDSYAIGAATVQISSAVFVGPVVSAGTAQIANSAVFEQPTGGTVNYAINSQGNSIFSGTVPDSQTIAVGTYLGVRAAGVPSVQLASSVVTVNISNTGSAMTFEKSGIAVLGQFDYSGNFTASGTVDTTGLKVKEASNGKQGTATLVAGTVTVANTSVTATSRIMLTAQSLGTVTTPSALCVSARTAGTSFTILASQNNDTSVVAYEIFEVG